MQRALGAALRDAGEGQARTTPLPRRGRNSVESYYLPGQGALFVSKRVDRSRYSKSSSVSALEKKLARLDPVDEEVLQAARESMDDPEELSHVSGLLGVPTSQAASSAPEAPASSALQQAEGDDAAVGGQQAQTGVDLRQLALAKRRIALEREIVKRREAEARRNVEAREQLEQSVRTGGGRAQHPWRHAQHGGACGARDGRPEGGPVFRKGAHDASSLRIALRDQQLQGGAPDTGRVRAESSALRSVARPG